MNQILSSLLFGAFLCLPLIVLLVRAARPRRMPWWAAFALVVLLGWGFVLAAAMAAETPDNGAPKVFALFFGWAYGLAWFAPWLLGYGIVQLIRRLYANWKA
jgi:hypothetical protein